MFSHLTVYRSSSLRIELNLREIFLVTNETKLKQQRLEDRINERLDRDRLAQDEICAQVLAQFENTQRHRRKTKHHLTDVQGKPEVLVDNNQKSLQSDEHGSSITRVQNPLAVPILGSPGPDFGSKYPGHWSSIEVRADLSDMSQCSKSCKCSCHIRRRFSTPRLLDGFLGTLFVGYSGSPLLSQKCDDVSCHGRVNTTTSFVYSFPRWFVTSRVIQLKAKVTAMYGPEISLRFNRIVNGKALVFHYATIGDVSKMKQLFEQGRASPSDVRYDSGWTPFHVSVESEPGVQDEALAD